MKNILVATDFSKEAYCALHYATQLFKTEDTHFFVTNFFGDKIHESVYSIVNEEEISKKPKLYSKAHQAGIELVHKIILDTGIDKSRFELVISEQKFLNGLQFLVQDYDIDMVVMGTKKHHGSFESIWGTHTTRVIEKGLSVPVLVIPRELDYKEIKSIAFASDLKKPFAYKSIELLKHIALKSHAEVYVVIEGEELYMEKEQWKNYNDLKSDLDPVYTGIKFVSSHEEVSKTLSDYIKKNDFDMLSMIYYKHGFSDSLFREPVVLKIDKHLAFPFLILPEESAI